MRFKSIIVVALFALAVWFVWSRFVADKVGR